MPNDHVRAYLDEYLKQPKAHFAVLVSGAWGSGKTYVVKGFFDEIIQRRHLYVSVNGVSTEEELRSRFVYAAYPAVANKTLRALGSLARSALGIVNFNTDLSAEQLLDYDQFDIFVIDDIERARVDLLTLFGFVNDFVEHDGKQVILLGNEEELKSLSPDYKRIKEKLIGFTLGVYPDVESLLPKIELESSGPLGETLRAYKSDIIHVFAMSKSNNLRVLTQVLTEYQPIAETLAKTDHLSNTFKTEVLKLFLSINISYKLGKISRADIASRKTDHFALAFSEEKEVGAGDPMRQIDDIYNDIDIFSSAIDNEYLESKICDGIHREEFLSRSLGDAAAQADPGANPEWRNAWHYMRNDDVITEGAFRQMLARFEAREYHEAGVILHTFGLLLEMRKIGLLTWTEKRVEKEGKRYIDDLAARGDLPLFGEDFLTGFRHGAAHGLGFTNNDSPVFSVLWNHYKKKSDELKEQELVEMVRRSAASLGTDHRHFLISISPDEGWQEVRSTPVLQYVDARAFAKMFMGLGAVAQFETMAALGSRYESNPYPGVLRGELAWLRRLRSAIRGELRGKAKLTRVRIERLLTWNLAEHLADPDRQDDS